jgi:hypothetical protein
MFVRLFKWLRGHRQSAKEQPDEFGFVPVKDKDGNVTGVMDSMMADYLASDAPDHTQRTLDVMLAQVTRIKVFDGGMIDDKVLDEKIGAHPLIL